MEATIRDAFQDAASHAAAVSGVVCLSGVGAEAAPEVAGGDAVEADVGIPVIRGAPGEGSCVRREKRPASLLRSRGTVSLRECSRASGSAVDIYIM